MKDLYAKFSRIEQTQYGPKAVFTGQKGEWKPMSVLSSLDLTSLVAGENYKLTIDDSAQFWVLAKYEKSEPKPSGGRSWGGGRAYDPLNFVSNVVGQAIVAKLIIKPEDVGPWARAAWAVTEKS